MARTGGSASWLVLIALGAAAAANPFGCAGKGPGANGGIDEQAIADVLAAVGPEVVIPTLQAFQSEAALLATAVAAWESTAQSGGDTLVTRAAAQVAFQAAMAVWQEAEMLQIGPAAASLTAIAGEDLRDEIYSWPTINFCRVDQETVEEAWGAPDFCTLNLVNSYGLDATEHLLFSDPDNDCPGQVDINADGTWDALGTDGVELNRAEFSVALVEGVISTSDELLTTWEENFSASLADAGGDDSVYASVQEGLNAVYDALFYLETETKDAKLARPLGLGDCAEATCPEDVEGREAGDSIARIRANLVGFRALFTGGEGKGMDELLDEVGHGDLATQIVADTDAAIALADSLPGTVDGLVASNPSEVQALHDAVKLVTDALKGDVATVLTLQIPNEAAGDAD